MSQTAGPRSAELRVLLLEDVTTDAELVERELRRGGRSVTCLHVRDASAFGEALSSFAPDVVLSDYTIPGFSGIEAIEETGRLCPGLPVIIVTGTLSDETAVDCLKRGAADYVLKDRLSKLGPAIESALEARGAREDRARALVALTESERRLELALEGADLGMWDWDLVSDRVFRDQRWHTMLGYQPGGIDDHAGAYRELVHPDDLPQVVACEEEVKSGARSSFYLETRLRTASAGWKWVLNSGKVVERDPSGRPTRAAGTHLDVDRRKSAERLLAERQRRYELASSAGNVGVYEWNVRTGELYLDPQIKTMLGLEPREIPDHQDAWMERCHPDDRPRVEEAAAAHLRGHTATFGIECRLLHKDGRVRWFLVRGAAMPGPDGRRSRVLGTAVDITETHRTRDELFRANQLLTSVIDSSPLAVMATDLEGTVNLWSRAAERILGFSEQEAVGHFLPSYTPEMKARSREILAQLLQDAPFVDRETTRLRKDGSMAEVSLSVAPLRDQHGTATGLVGIMADIGEKKRIEQALRESEARLSSIFRAAPIGIGVTVDRILVQVNQRLCEITGYSAEELIGQSARIVYPSQEEYDWVGHEKYAQIRERGTGTVETQWRRKDGRIIDVLLSSTPLSPREENRGVTFTALDITERKQAERLLRTEKERAQDYLDIVASLIVALDREGRITLFNQAAGQILGADPRWALGRSWFDTFLPERNREVVRGVFSLLMSGESDPVEHFDNEVRTRDGEIRLIHWHNRLLHDEGGAVVGTLSAGQDITERQRVEGTLVTVAKGVSARGEACFEFLVMSLTRALGAEIGYVAELEPGATPRVHTVALVMDGELTENITYDLAGTPCAEVVGTAPCFVISGVQQRFPGDELLGELGAEGYVGAPLVDSAGRVLGLVAALFRKPIESPRLAESLLQVFAVRAANELERSRAERALVESERMAAMGSIVGAVAHEVRNPLFGISATLDAFEARHGQGVFGSYLSALRQQVDRLSDLMRDLLEYGRPHKTELREAPLPALVEEAASWCRALAEQKQVELRVTVSPDLPQVALDRGRLGRVFRNLVENAIQHSPDSADVEIELRRTTGSQVECVVSDAGPGFDPEDLPRVFEPFFTRRRGGTGLGLAIAWRTVTEHGGSIVAENASGGGAVVTVRLPAYGAGDDGKGNAEG